MKKLALLFAGAMIAGSGTAAFGNAVLTVPGVGSADAGSAGYTVVVDGASGFALDGYLGIDAAGGLVCGAEGGPFNDDGSESDEYGTAGCDPTTLVPAPPV